MGGRKLHPTRLPRGDTVRALSRRAGAGIPARTPRRAHFRQYLRAPERRLRGTSRSRAPTSTESACSTSAFVSLAKTKTSPSAPASRAFASSTTLRSPACTTIKRPTCGATAASNNWVPATRRDCATSTPIYTAAPQSFGPTDTSRAPTVSYSLLASLRSRFSRLRQGCGSCGSVIRNAERRAVPDPCFIASYRCLIGLYTFRGFREGLRELGSRKSQLNPPLHRESGHAEGSETGLAPEIES